MIHYLLLLDTIPAHFIVALTVKKQFIKTGVEVLKKNPEALIALTKHRKMFLFQSNFSCG